MAKQAWKGGNMLYPLPAVMVSCANEAGERDIVTVAWAGTVCTNPPMLSISLRPERHSYHIVRESGEFVVNLVTTRLQRACDWCGVRSGLDFDKWAECGLTPAPAATLELAPAIEESPVSIECRVRDVLELGSHHLFLADVTAVQVEEGLLDARGRLDLGRAGLTAYSHGEYFELGRRIGSFGYSVRKDRPRQGPRRGGRPR
ncbi:flavin reductase family protein [Thermophilibacter sp. ZX-H3]|uniref:flavin reductase family protein n=1 Tax=unclassified Thermophilibacter TaxID=2847308 RepID=UPI00404070D8